MITVGVSPKPCHTRHDRARGSARLISRRLPASPHFLSQNRRPPPITQMCQEGVLEQKRWQRGGVVRTLALLAIALSGGVRGVGGRGRRSGDSPSSSGGAPR